MVGTSASSDTPAWTMGAAMAAAKRLDAALGPVVEFVAHVDRLGEDGFQAQTTHLADTRTDCGRPDVPPSLQGFEGVLAELAELLAPFHLAAESPVPEGPVLDNKDPHRGCDGARHGPDRPVVVIRLEGDLPALQHSFSLVGGLRPLLEKDSSDHRASLRS